MVVPEELRGIVGHRALVHVGLPPETRARKRRAIGFINSFLMRVEEAREVREALGEASKPTLAVQEPAVINKCIGDSAGRSQQSR